MHSTLLTLTTLLGLTLAAPQLSTRSSYDPSIGANVTFYDATVSAHAVSAAFPKGSKCLNFPGPISLKQVAELQVVPGPPPGDLGTWEGMTVGVSFFEERNCAGYPSNAFIRNLGKGLTGWYLGMPVWINGVKVNATSMQFN
jgi:hypothetical protein